MGIISQYLPEIAKDEPSIVWHYTTQEGLLGILKTKSIWMTKIQFLNDSREFSLAYDLFIRALSDYLINGEKIKPKTITEVKNIIEAWKFEPVYVCSFSFNKDALSQWRAYSNNTIGFAIGISTLQLNGLAQKYISDFGKCVYKNEDQIKIIKLFLTKSITNNQKLSSILASVSAFSNDDKTVTERTFMLMPFVNDFMQIAPFIKDQGFNEEKEWRLVFRNVDSENEFEEKLRPGNSMLIPYIELPLQVHTGEITGIEGVVVGPSPHPELSIESVRIALHRNSIKYSILEKSTIPFRNW